MTQEVPQELITEENDTALSGEAFLAQVRGMRTTLSRDLAELDRRRKMLTDALGLVDEMLALLERAALGNERPKPRPRRSRIRTAIAEVLREAKSPLHAAIIMSAVRMRGVPLSDKDPKGSVVTALLRMRNDGEVRLLGNNVFEWTGQESDEDASGDVPESPQAPE